LPAVTQLVVLDPFRARAATALPHRLPLLRDLGYDAEFLGGRLVDALVATGGREDIARRVERTPLRMALISRRGPLSPAVWLSWPERHTAGLLIGEPYKAHRDCVLDALPGLLLQSAYDDPEPPRRPHPR
jgi:hypothetical protein